MKRIIIAVLLSLGLGLGLMAANQNAAHANGVGQICDQTAGNGGYCLNAWFNGPDVKSYHENNQVFQNAFTPVGVDRCNNGYYTTANCPFAGVPAGLFIEQFWWTASTDKCVGSFNDGTAGLGTCNNQAYPGLGGTQGTIFVAIHATCGSGANAAINSYWTGKAGGAYRLLFYNDGDGNTITLDETSVGNCLYYLPGS
ncbi:MAG TPA: hypothetical protein VNB49_10480 [Candidatus Dormibacteraeota bacterium]|nr:hypothetical protein [Candidatus Dormibacteraeota bacterium]